jgi:cyclopropane fatty-acyl-phospholipid synthase-like methyltransferase
VAPLGPTLEEWLGQATEVMLDMAEVGPGARVLDVAAGAGGQTIAAAKRVGSTGYVLATDIAARRRRVNLESSSRVGDDQGHRLGFAVRSRACGPDYSSVDLVRR